MTVTIESSRFGTVEILPDSIVDFPAGLIGLGGARYTLLARDEGGAFLWLHSVDDPNLALPVVRPLRFFPDFALDLAPPDQERIGLSAGDSADVFVTVRAAAELSEFTANLRAPIVIWQGVGHQVINMSDTAQLRAPLFPDAPAAGQASSASAA
jgi:flagellar assembly factor FliW